MGDYGFKVAKTGYNVASPDTAMVFTSKLLSERIIMSPPIQSVGPLNSTATQTITFTHNLGYIPQFIAWDWISYNVSIPYWINGTLNPYSGITGLSWTADAVATTTTITVTFVFTGGTPSNLYLGAEVLILAESM